MTEETNENKNEEVAADNLRFTVGKDYFFINVDFKKGVEGFLPLFQPWNGDTITKIEIVKLTCAEHHKVRWDYDDATAEPKYDGFVFTDDTGMRWYNQYPKASYGQLDDSADRTVIRSEPINDSDPWENYTKMETYLRRIADGVSRFTATDGNEKYDEEELRLRPIAAESLQKHFDEIVELLKEKFNLTVATEPYTIETTDRITGEKKTHTLSNRTRVRLGYEEPPVATDALTEEEYRARKDQLKASAEVQPYVIRSGILDMQVCVPKKLTDEEVTEFANRANPSGTESGWTIRHEGHKALNGDPERVQCNAHESRCHIMLEC